MYLVDEPEPTELQTVKSGEKINSDSSDNEIMENIDKFLLGNNNDQDPNLQMIIRDFNSKSSQLRPKEKFNWRSAKKISTIRMTHG